MFSHIFHFEYLFKSNRENYTSEPQAELLKWIQVTKSLSFLLLATFIHCICILSAQRSDLHTSRDFNILWIGMKAWVFYNITSFWTSGAKMFFSVKNKSLVFANLLTQGLRLQGHQVTWVCQPNSEGKRLDIWSQVKASFRSNYTEEERKDLIPSAVKLLKCLLRAQNIMSRFADWKMSVCPKRRWRVKGDVFWSSESMKYGKWL